ncbi:hypothetical protein GC170_00730 [bacterium]|nr:hypothetical protein [bacterium]
MSHGIDLQRFFGWVNRDRNRVANRAKEQRLFAPLADELEARRLLTLNVWIDDSNFVQIEADDNLAQYVQLVFDSNTSTYTVTSLNSASNFFIVSDTSSGLTVSKSDYGGVGVPAQLTIVQNPGVVEGIEVTTGDSPDTVEVAFASAPVSVNTAGGSDTIVHTMDFNTATLNVDGGPDIDSIYTSYAFTGSFNITQNLAGTGLGSQLFFDTAIGVNAPSNFINIRANNVEDVIDSVNAPNSNLTITINGFNGNPNGGFLDRTALDNLSISSITSNKTVHLFGYETNDDIQVDRAVSGANDFIGINGSRLPKIDIYNMNPAQGILRLRTFEGDDIVKVAPGVENLTRISVDGGAGDDFLSADATLIGGPGNDTLQGGLGNDSLVGNDGDDVFLISSGNDTVDGGAGFDILQLIGATAAPNFFGIQQDNGSPAFIQLNATLTNVGLTDVDLISVQGSTGQDFLLVTGNSLAPVPILATLGLGNDIVDTNQAPQGQLTQAYGEGGEDYFLTGPGSDYFYGGDDYDLFDVMYASRDSYDYIDGGGGFNDLYVEGSAFGNNVVTAIPSGFQVSNTNGIAYTTALNIGFVFVDSAGSGVILNASDDDNLIRTFDSESDLVPPLPDNELLVTGMPGEIRVIGIESGSFVEIHGQGGNDTFESLGNAGARLSFFGESGDDTMIVGEESKLATFTGGVGIDSVEVTTTLGNDTVIVASSVPGESVNVNGTVLAQIVQAERLAIDLLAGDDTLTMTSIGANTGLIDYEFSGGDGNDQITMIGFTALAGSVFHVWGGSGNDGVLAANVSNALLIAFGGAGDDSMQTSLRAELYGDEGDDTLIGSDLTDTISGGDGNDQIIGAGSRDFLYGDAGQDVFFWDSVDDGDDVVDGGTGQDALNVAPNNAVPNDFTLTKNAFLQNLFDVIIAGNVISGGEVEQVDLRGSSSTDNFTVNDLTGTSITDVNIRLGFDQVADNVFVQGTTANDFIVISGSDETLINGLPWLIRVMDAQFSATTLVDGILFDGHLGEDTIITASNLINPVLVTIHGGAGGDDIRINSPTLGDNTDRVTVDVSADVFADVIQLRNGRNRVVGGDLDVLLVSGTENDDLITVIPDGGGRIDISLSPPGFSSSNDLTAFSGVVHVEGLGGNDEIRMLADLRSTIWGGDGNDLIFVGPGGALAYGDSGNDQMTGGIGNDTFYGGAGNDDLLGEEGNDILYGEDGEDLLFGGLGLDLLYGGADSDLLLPGKNGTLAPEFVDGGSGQDQIRFDLNGTAGIIGRTAGVLNVGEFGEIGAATGFNSVDAENLLVIVDSTVPGSTGFDLNVQDLTGSQVNFIRAEFVDETDANTLVLNGTIAGDVIDADYVLPPGGEPNAQVLMPWGTVWAYKPASQLANDTLQIQGQAGDDVIKVSDALSIGAFGWNIVLDGGAGNDFLSADATIVGGDGNDTLQGGTGDDLLEGNAGDDVFLISDGLDTFVGGAGFDVVRVSGSQNGDNLFGVDQTVGLLTSFDVNLQLYTADLVDIDLISVQGGNARDELFVTGNSATPVAITAFLGTGDDLVVTSGNVAPNQIVTAWGEAGNDDFISGPGTDYFYGGSEYDIFVVSANAFDSNDWFDGGTGFNELVVNTPPAGTTTVTAIPSGFSVFNSDYTGGTIALNIGNLMINGGGGIVINGSNNDDTIRTFDSNSDLVPPLAPATLLVAGLGADIYINGVVPNQSIGIHGEGGNDTFQSLGNAEAFLTFYGDSGDDQFVITEESRFASFVGGDGYDRMSLQGSAFSEMIEIFSSPPATISMAVDSTLVGDATDAEEFSVDGMGGSDDIRALIDQFVFNFLNFKIYGGAGNDIIDLNVGGGSYGNFTVDGGAGEDYLIGSPLANTQILLGGLGNDRIETYSAAAIFGNEGNDTLIGSIGNDTMSGGDGDDQIVGDAGNDVLFGDAGQDVLSGGDGFDALYGGADSDLLLPGSNDSITPEIVDGGSGLDQVRFDLAGISGLIGRTAGTVNVGGFGGTTLFNSTDVEDLLADANTTVPGATGIDVAIQDLTGSQVNFVRVIFSDPNDRNRLTMQGTIANDTIDASYVLPPGGTPNAQVLMPWGTVWAFTQGAPAPLNTLQIEGREGNDVIKTSPLLNEGAFAWNIVLHGDEGNDFLSADATIVGGAGDDTLQGGLGDDSLEGGDGDDVFLLSAGLDTFVGGAGFDVVHVEGSVNDSNLITVDQSAGMPLWVAVNATIHTADVSEIEQISVQGGNSRDTLFVTGDSLDPIDITAFLGAGDDVIDTSGNDSPNQVVKGWGEAGNDVFLSGPGTNFFYGGDEYDIFVVSENSFDSIDWFDGGTGFNELVVDTPPLGTTTISPIASGFEVFNTDYAGKTTALNIGSLVVNGGGGGIVIDGSNNDDTIRTFDSTSDLVPPPAVGTLLIAGLGADIYINGIVPGQFIGIHGQGGNDTFQSLGNAQSNLNFFGDSGDDTFDVTHESALARFVGGAGLDTVNVSGTMQNDALIFQDSGLNTLNFFDAITLRAEIVQADSLTVNGLAGSDRIEFQGEGPLTGLTRFEINGGEGGDFILLDGTKLGTYVVNAGEGNDSVIGPDGFARAVIYGGAGNDEILGGSAALEVYGESGNDTVFGSTGDDTIYGGDGDDSIIAGLGNDQIFGGADQDEIRWSFGDGSDSVDGGTGQDTLIADGNQLGLPNNFELRANPVLANLYRLTIDGSSIGGGEIEHVMMGGGISNDIFSIGDLSTTSINLVDVNFGTDAVADNVFVQGTMNNDTILLTGTNGLASVTGLPWLVRVSDILANGGTLVDGVAIDGHYGDDWIRSGIISSSPMLVTINGGQGADFLEVNTTPLGDNPNRVTVIADGDVFADRILLTNGRNLVFGSANDVIEVNGTENADTITVSGDVDPGRVVFDVNGQTSSNDLTNFLGVMHIDALGGNDLVYTRNYTIPTSVFGGLGDDIVDSRTMNVPVSLYGGNGDDMLIGGKSNDFIDGGEGLDQIFAGFGDDRVEGGSGSDSIFYAAGEGQDLVDGGEGVNNLYVYGLSDGNNQFVLYADLFDPTAIDIDVNNIARAVTAVSIQGIKLQGGDFGDDFTMHNLVGTPLQSLIVDVGIDTDYKDTVSFDGTIGNDTIGVGSDVLRDVQVTGLSYKARVTGFNFNPVAPVIDRIVVNGDAGYDTIFANASLTSPVEVRLNGDIGNDQLFSEAPDLTNPGGRFRVTLDGGTGNDEFTVSQGSVYLVGSGADILHIDGNVLNNQMGIVMGIDVLNYTLDGSLIQYNVRDYSGTLSIDAQGGNDTVFLQAYAFASTVLGGLGNDRIDATGLNVPVSIYGGSGDDSLTGGSADDYLAGEAGYDFLTGAGGFDLVEGGSEGDYIYWNAGDGVDYIDGGTGENSLVFTGAAADSNHFVLLTDDDPATGGRLTLINGGLIDGHVDFASVQLVRMIGGTGKDSFLIPDLTGTDIKVIEADFGIDSSADELIVSGTDNADDVTITGSSKVTVAGLPWKITASNAAIDGTILVDSVTVDLGLGNDRILAATTLTAPVLLNLNAGQGADEIRVETTSFGSNPYRTSVNTTKGFSPTRLWLENGRNTVIGKASDVIMVEGTENDDAFAIIEGSGVDTVISIDGNQSINNLTQYNGVIHVNLLGGNDEIKLSGYSTRTSVFGGAGSDFIDAVGMEVPVSLYGGDGNDALYGGVANDVIDGGAGNDSILGNHGDDSIYGGDGTDRFFWYTGDGHDKVDGGTGDDRLVFTAEGSGDHKVTLTPDTSTTPSTANGIGSGNANLILAALEGNGSVTGGSIESVLLEGGNGCDLFGIGNLQTTDVRVVDVVINNVEGHAVVSTYATNLPDVITVTADSPDQIGVNGLAVPVRVFGTVADATAIVVHAGFGGDTIEVDPQAEAQAIIVIDGGAGNDTITGGSIIIGGPGNNLLIGSDGPNTIVGGTGSDTIYGLGANDTLFGDAEVLNIDILGPNCEYIGNLIILPTATGAPDSIFGGDGDDFINGNVGADSIYGGEGHDDIGALTYNGIFFPEAGNDLIDAGEGDNCVFAGTGNDTVTAGNGNNRIVLDEGDDTATTGNGNNSIFGGAGNDTVTTGAGNDVVALGAGDDKATLGSGNDIAWGEDGNDFIIGQYGNDSLYGGAGNDILWGGLKATQPLKRGQKHAPIEPSDGDDVLAGNDGFDQLDGGNSNNIMDAGADYIRETMVGSGGWDTAYIHKDEGKFQDVLKNHSKRYTLIPYGAMMIPVVPATPTDCDSPILVSVPNPLAGALSSPPKKTAVPKPTAIKRLRGR